MKATATVKTWEKTRHQNLVRHKSGRYYARLFLNGKEIWKTLKTSHFSVAEAKLAELQKEHRERKAKHVDPANAKMRFGQGATLHMHRITDNVALKRSTRKYWQEIKAALLKSWPELDKTEIRKLTPAACREWSVRYAKQTSPTRFNATIAFLGHVIELAIECGITYSNPAKSLERRSVRAKQLTLPTRSQFSSFIAEMSAGRSRDSKNCADLAQGLAYTGCRISEAAQIKWADLDFSIPEIVVKGDPEERTKNGEIRRVPMLPSAKKLFKCMRAQRSEEGSQEKVFRVYECQKSMERAAGKIGMVRITHHDLRHFFATICIESGVDIPTVSRWLGHKDGGALAMRTYGHLRREHSLAQAQKVHFAPTPESAVQKAS
jgi:integrase